MGKKDIVKYIIEEYGVTSATDIINALKDLLGETLQEMMDAKFEEHMRNKKHEQKTEKTNYRNGSTRKTVKTSQGKVELEIPRDRNSSFQLVIVENNCRDISDVDSKIINLYARGMSTGDIRESINDIYGIDVSAPMISTIESVSTVEPIAKLEPQTTPQPTVEPIPRATLEPPPQVANAVLIDEKTTG